MHPCYPEPNLQRILSILVATPICSARLGGFWKMKYLESGPSSESGKTRWVSARERAEIPIGTTS